MALVCFCRCERETSPVLEIEANHVGSIPVGELFDDVRYVRLEDGHLLDQVFQAVYVDGTIFLNTGREIAEFAEDGSYVRSISHLGRGPGEYLDINAFHVDGGHVYIMDRNRNLLKYTVDDEFVASTRLDYYAGSIYAEGGTLLVTSGYQNAGDKFHVLDSETLAERLSFFPIEENRMRYRQFMFMNDYVRVGDELVYYEPMNECVYTLDLSGGVADLRYEVDLMGGNPPKGFWDRSYESIVELLQSLEKGSYNHGFSSFYEGDESIYFTFNSPGSESRFLACVYDKAEGESRQFSSFLLPGDLPAVEVAKVTSGFCSDGVACFVLPVGALGETDNENPVVLLAGVK